MLPLEVAYGLLAVLLLAVRAVRRASPVAVTVASPSARRSTAALGAAHGLAVVSGALFPALGLGRLPVAPAVAWAGVGAMGCGLVLQLAAMRALGAAFTLTLRTVPSQRVVARGPYRVVRHPAYLAQLVVWLGFAVASRNALVLGLVAPAVVLAYGFRIRAEEAMLRRALGDAYGAYAAGRAALLPGVW